MRYIDPKPRERGAIVALAAHTVFLVIYMLLKASGPAAGFGADIVAVAVFVALIAAVVATAMWVYRINANAHVFAEALSITPGWNVGWFFVPFANLWKPFEGIRESWQASADPANWHSVPVPAILRLWWGCWLVGNILSNAALQVSYRIGDASLAATLDLIASALLSVAGATLIVIIVRLSRMQRVTNAIHVFA